VFLNSCGIAVTSRLSSEVSLCGLNSLALETRSPISIYCHTVVMRVMAHTRVDDGAYRSDADDGAYSGDADGGVYVMVHT
jgi:hypothetical protein